MEKMISIDAHKALVLSEVTKAKNDLLKEIMKNSHYCEHCLFNHDGFCFLAYNCITNDYFNFNDGDDSELY